LHLAGVGLELRLDGAVAQTSLLVRLVALDLGLDVCHEVSSPVLMGWVSQDCGGTEAAGTAVGIRLETSVPESLPRVLARVARTARPLRHFGRTPLRTPNGMSHIQGAILTEDSHRTGAHVRRVSRSAMRAPPAPRRPHRARTRRAEPARPPAARRPLTARRRAPPPRPGRSARGPAAHPRVAPTPGPGAAGGPPGPPRAGPAGPSPRRRCPPRSR